MKHWLRLIAFTLGITLAQAGVINVTYTVTDFGMDTNSVKRVTLTPISAGGNVDGIFLAPTTMSPNSWTNGTAIFSNRVAGYAYRVGFETRFSTTYRTNYFETNVVGNVNGADHLVSSIPLDSGLVAYSMIQADSRFLRTNINRYVIPGTNVSFTTNGNTLTISSTASGSGVDTPTVVSIMSSNNAATATVASSISAGVTNWVQDSATNAASSATNGLAAALGTAAFSDTTAFDAAGTAQDATNTLASTLGSAAYSDTTAFDAAGAAAAATNGLAATAFSTAASNLTGTIDIDRLSGITSNQIDSATDAAYRTVADTSMLSNRLVGTEWFVHPTATNGQGTLLSPWSLAQARTNALIQPGDVVWLRGGEYDTVSSVDWYVSGVTVMAYPNEQPVIRRQFNIYSTNSVFAGLCRVGTNTSRVSAQSGSAPTDITTARGFQFLAAGNRLQDCVIHDVVGDGIDCFSQASNSVISGCLIYNVGWDAPDRSHGHGIYTQNKEGTKRIVGNCIFRAGTLNLKPTGTTASQANNFDIRDNVTFNDGELWTNSTGEVALGGGQLTNTVLAGNVFYEGNTVTSYAYFGIKDAGLIAATNLFVTNNVFMCAVLAVNLEQFTFTGNTIYRPSSQNAPVVFYQPADTVPSWTWDENQYFRTSASGYQLALTNQVVGTNYSFSNWQAVTGWDSNSVQTLNMPTEPESWIKTNQYSPGRAFIAIRNWPTNDVVEVDVSSIIASNSIYTLSCVENPTETISGFCSGNTITIPMTNWSVAAPLGVATPTSTLPRFGVFLITGNSNVSYYATTAGSALTATSATTADTANALSTALSNWVESAVSGGEATNVLQIAASDSINVTSNGLERIPSLSSSVTNAWQADAATAAQRVTNDLATVAFTGAAADLTAFAFPYLTFSDENYAGLRLNNLTGAQRDALENEAAGDLFYNASSNVLQYATGGESFKTLLTLEDYTPPAAATPPLADVLVAGGDADGAGITNAGPISTIDWFSGPMDGTNIVDATISTNKITSGFYTYLLSLASEGGLSEQAVLDIVATNGHTFTSETTFSNNVFFWGDSNYFSGSLVVDDFAGDAANLTNANPTTLFNTSSGVLPTAIIPGHTNVTLWQTTSLLNAAGDGVSFTPADGVLSLSGLFIASDGVAGLLSGTTNAAGYATLFANSDLTATHLSAGLTNWVESVSGVTAETVTNAAITVATAATNDLFSALGSAALEDTTAFDAAGTAQNATNKLDTDLRVGLSWLTNNFALRTNATLWQTTSLLNAAGDGVSFTPADGVLSLSGLFLASDGVAGLLSGTTNAAGYASLFANSTLDATKLSGALPALDGSALTGVTSELPSAIYTPIIFGATNTFGTGTNCGAFILVDADTASDYQITAKANFIHFGGAGVDLGDSPHGNGQYLTNVTAAAFQSPATTELLDPTNSVACGNPALRYNWTVTNNCAVSALTGLSVGYYGGAVIDATNATGAAKQLWLAPSIIRKGGMTNNSVWLPPGTNVIVGIEYGGARTNAAAAL